MVLFAACNGASSDDGSSSGASTADSGEETAADADGGDADSGSADVSGGEDNAEDARKFDVGSGDTPGDDHPEGCAPAQECVDTTASAVLSLVPCDAWQATFFPPYDEHYECWTADPLGHLVGDTDVDFAAEDPDLLLLGRWDGGIAQIRVTRDAACNITGFADSGWESYAASEPSDVRVKGLAHADDGTMFLVRMPIAEGQGPIPQLGQRAPGAGVTSHIVELMSFLPVWPAMIYTNNPAVGMVVVPPGFPGAGSLKLIAEKPSTSHWFTVPLAADNSGTYDVAPAIEQTQIYPPETEWGGYYARGIAYVGVENPAVDVPSVFIPEAWHYIVSIYEVDAEGDPLPDTRTPFVEGLGMPSGAERDAVSTNNFVFTGRRSQSVYVVRGCTTATPGDPAE